jgi:integrase
MLRHACGYALANRGHDTRALQAYLGHKNIQHTVRYTELSPTRPLTLTAANSAAEAIRRPSLFAASVLFITALVLLSGARLAPGR